MSVLFLYEPGVDAFEPGGRLLTLAAGLAQDDDVHGEGLRQDVVLASIEGDDLVLRSVENYRLGLNALKICLGINVYTNLKDLFNTINFSMKS